MFEYISKVKIINLPISRMIHGEDISSWGTDAEKMNNLADYNPGSGYGLWLKDITFDSSKTIKLQVYDWSNDSWKSQDSDQPEITSSTNKT